MTQSAEGVMDEGERRQLQDRIIRYRMMKRGVTDPLALSLLHDIIAELEATLRERQVSAVVDLSLKDEARGAVRVPRRGPAREEISICLR